jgi:hypothetical protein
MIMKLKNQRPRPKGAVEPEKKKMQTNISLKARINDTNICNLLSYSKPSVIEVE